MLQGKLDIYGDRIRDKNEINMIKEDLRQYLSSKDTGLIKKYLDNWGIISKQKGYSEESLLDVLKDNINHQDRYLTALAIDIWDAFHPLSPKDAKRHNIMLRKRLKIFF